MNKIKHSVVLGGLLALACGSALADQAVADAAKAMANNAG